MAWPPGFKLRAIEADVTDKCPNCGKEVKGVAPAGRFGIGVNPETEVKAVANYRYACSCGCNWTDANSRAVRQDMARKRGE